MARVADSMITSTLVNSNGFDSEFYAQAIRELVGVDVDRTWQSYRHVTDSGILAGILEQHRTMTRPTRLRQVLTMGRTFREPTAADRAG